MTLRSEDVATLSRLLDEAMTLPRLAQEAWLEALPVSANHLAGTLRRLLQDLADGGGGLETLPRLDDVDAAGVPTPGATVGPYRLRRELGRGGMAVVWEAERDDGLVTRCVALKMPLQRLHRSAHVERFERERDALSRLAHPGIARLYDAGVTASGQPYIVLERVTGVPITQHCDALRLDLAARVRLFLQVLAAVGHAHKHLVIHRDLKPSNVFVDETGAVKLLDFGIAKLTTLPDGAAAASTLTRDAGAAMTLRYAAPEQVAGEGVSTATDVYALGLLLYELLTGDVPHAQRPDSMAHMVQAVLEDEAAAPSRAPIDAAVAACRGQADPERLRARLRGDLDTIVLETLHKAPAERYGSVERLADDLVAWLEQRPIRARPPTLHHRARLFVRRHRGATAAAAIGLAGALGLGGVALLQHQRGLEEFARAEAMRDFMFDFVNDAEATERQAAEPTGRDLLAAAIQRARSGFGDQPRVRGELLAELGRMSRRLGDGAGATRLLTEAVGLLEANAPPGDGPLNKARSFLAVELLTDGRVEEAGALASTVVARCREGLQCTKARYYAHSTLGSVEMRRGDYASALVHARLGVQESRAAFGPGDAQTAAAQLIEAVVARQAGRLLEARAALDRAKATARDQSLRRIDRVAMGRMEAVLALDLGDFTPALERATALAGQAPRGPEQVLLWRLASEAQWSLGRVDEAIGLAQRAIDAGDPPGQGVQGLVARQAHARALALAGRGAEAEQALAAVAAGLKEAGYPEASVEVLRPWRLIGELRLRAGDAAAALKTLLAVAQPLEAASRPSGRAALEAAQAFDLVGCALLSQGLATEALRWHDKAAPLWRDGLPATHPLRRRHEVLRHLAGADARASDADARLQQLLSALREGLPPGSHWSAAFDRAAQLGRRSETRGDACRLLV